MENGDWRRLDSLQPGESLACVGADRYLSSCEVIAKRCVGERECVSVSTHRCHVLVGLENIMLMAADEYRPLSKIMIGEWILGRLDDGRMGWDCVERVEPSGIHLIFELDVSGQKNFIAEGLVVHD